MDKRFSNWVRFNSLSYSCLILGPGPVLNGPIAISTLGEYLA